MAKTKYKYNPETLSYEEHKLSFREKFWRAILFILPSIVLLIIGGFLAITFFPTGKERALKKDIQALETSYEALEERTEKAEKVLRYIKDRDQNLLRATYGMDAYPDFLKNISYETDLSLDEISRMETKELLKNTSIKLDELEKMLYAQSKSFDQIEELAAHKGEMLAAIPSIQPISNKDLTRIASGFGMRMHPVYHIPKMHTGIDMTADVGTEIYATGDGIVEKVDYMGGYGKIVIVNHGFGYKTYYAHLNGYNVKVGQKVKRGEVIAFLGNSGVSTGPHLHYEVRKKITENGVSLYKPVDPVHYFFNDLTPEEFEKVLEIANRATYSLS